MRPRVPAPGAGAAGRAPAAACLRGGHCFGVRAADVAAADTVSRRGRDLSDPSVRT